MSGGHDIRQMDSYVHDWKGAVARCQWTDEQFDAFAEISEHVTDVWDMCDASEDDILKIIRTIRQGEAAHPQISSLVLVYAKIDPSCEG